MSSALALAAPESAAIQQAEDAQYYRHVLHELIDMGADLARLLHQQSHAEPAAQPAADAAIAFERIARVIRRTIALARKVAEPLPTPADHTAQSRTAARARIIREVEDVIQRKATDHQAETLHEELLDRLDSPNLDDAIDQRPTADIIVDICRDLGLMAHPGTHPWKRRTPADIIALCARAATPPASPKQHGSALHPQGNSHCLDPSLRISGRIPP